MQVRYLPPVSPGSNKEWTVLYHLTNEMCTQDYIEVLTQLMEGSHNLIDYTLAKPSFGLPPSHVLFGRDNTKRNPN